MDSHNHGPLQCEVCYKVVRQCVCLSEGRTVEWMVCPSCKADQAYETQQRTYALNQELKKLGVLYAGEKSKNDFDNYEPHSAEECDDPTCSHY